MMKEVGIEVWENEEELIMVVEDDDEESLEDKCYTEQYRLIEETKGKEAAEKANYGWCTVGDENYTSVATKVYGHGVLESCIHHETGDIAHRWSETWNKK